MWPIRVSHWDSLCSLLSLRLLPEMHKRVRTVWILSDLLENFSSFQVMVQWLSRKMPKNRLRWAGYCGINGEILPVMQRTAPGLYERHQLVRQNRRQIDYFYLMICKTFFNLADYYFSAGFFGPAANTEFNWTFSIRQKNIVWADCYFAHL